MVQYKAQYQSALVDVERQGKWGLKNSTTALVFATDSRSQISRPWYVAAAAVLYRMAG